LVVVANLDFSVFLQPAVGGGGNYLVYLLWGLVWTLLLSLVSWVIAFVVGSVVGVMRTTPGKILPKIGAVYVEIFRNIPLLVQLFIWYFVLPEIVPFFGTWFKQSIGPDTQQFISAALCLGFFTASRVSEQVRSGINSLGRGQFGAGLALGFNVPQVYRIILLPVAYRIIIPTLTSEFLNLIKNSAVASTIGLVELARRSGNMGEYTAKWYEALIAVTLLYAFVNLIVMAISRQIERATRLPGYLGGKK
jgi:glutamate/aspartate transport system permease protein